MFWKEKKIFESFEFFYHLERKAWFGNETWFPFRKSVPSAALKKKRIQALNQNR